MPSGSFTFPTKMESYTIHYDSYGVSIISTVKVRIYFTGLLKFFISANGGTTYEEVPDLISGIWKTYNLITTGADVVYRILGESGMTSIFTQLDGNNNIVEPAITIQML